MKAAVLALALLAALPARAVAQVAAGKVAPAPKAVVAESADDPYERHIRFLAEENPPRVAEAFDMAERARERRLPTARYPVMLDAKAVQAALRPDEIVVTFFLAEPYSFRWVMSHEHVVLDRIAGRAAIEEQVTRLRDLLRTPTSGDQVKTASAALGATLFDKISTADDRPLIVVPHGALHDVPFEVLPLQGKMLIERHAVSYAPSLNALVQLRRAPVNTAPFRVLAVGNSAPFAEPELFAIGRIFPDRTRILSGAGALESALRDAGMEQYAVVHFATHAGVLQMGEIYGLDLRANLVVLSARQTTLGGEIAGEGSIGLSRAVFHAGARSVVATLWNLDHQFAAAFVGRFYSELNEGKSAEAALRRAKQAYLEDPRYAHPFYWSSLVIMGDGTQAVVRQPVRPRTVPLALAVLFSLFAVLVAGVKLCQNAQVR